MNAIICAGDKWKMLMTNFNHYWHVPTFGFFTIKLLTSVNSYYHYVIEKRGYQHYRGQYYVKQLMFNSSLKTSTFQLFRHPSIQFVQLCLLEYQWTLNDFQIRLSKFDEFHKQFHREIFQRSILVWRLFHSVRSSGKVVQFSPSRSVRSPFQLHRHYPAAKSNIFYPFIN